MKWETVSLRFGGGNSGRMSLGGCFSLFYLCPSIGPILVSQTSNSSRQIQAWNEKQDTPAQEEVLAVLSLERHSGVSQLKRACWVFVFVFCHVKPSLNL